MKLAKLLEGLDIIELRADNELEITGITCDSRKVAPGYLFVAIEGFESDGHKYIASAFEKGAAAVICQKAPEADVPYALTTDSRKALAIASAHFYGDPAKKLKIIGVTGTNGKTTTTMLIKHLLESSEGVKVGLIGTNQNMIGETVLPTERTTPESCELQALFADMVEGGCTHVVMEVSSHSLVLSRVEGLCFEVGIFTNLTQDHLDFHITMENYAEAKALLFRQSKNAVINLDDQWSEMMLTAAQDAGCKVLTYSAKRDDADVTAHDIRLYPHKVKFCTMMTGELFRATLHIPGRFSVHNALSVITCGAALGFTAEECAKALESAQGVKGRMEVVPAGEDYTIVIDYAHTPDALEKVLKSMKEVATGRVVALFGCGGDRDRTKRPIMGKIAAENADFVVVTSDNPRTEDPEAIVNDILEGMKGTKTPKKVIVNRPEAIAWAMDNHKEGDVIILAGKGHETYQIVGKIKNHMDEREIVAEHLAATRIGG